MALGGRNQPEVAALRKQLPLSDGSKIFVRICAMAINVGLKQVASAQSFSFLFFVEILFGTVKCH